MRPGAQYVMIPGPLLMPMWSVDSWATPDTVSWLAPYSRGDHITESEKPHQ